MEKLTVGQALKKATVWLDAAEKVKELESRMALATMAQAYSAYAQALTLYDGTVDVRARVESGI